MPSERYSGIYQDLKEKIESGVYKPQTFLPSETMLSARFKCSRGTVRRAIAMLAEDSYVQSIHGKGVVVIYREPPANRFAFGEIETMREAFARNGRDYRTKVLEFTTLTVDRRLSKKTGFSEGEEVYFIQRLRLLDGEPVILDNNFFLTRIIPGLTPEIAEQSVYDYLEKELGDTIVTTKRVLTVEEPTEMDEKVMDLSDCHAMAVVTSETYNAEGEMFEYTQSRHKPKYFSFYTVARRKHAYSADRNQ